MKNLKTLIYLIIGGVFIVAMFLFDRNTECKTSTERKHKPGRVEFNNFIRLGCPGLQPRGTCLWRNEVINSIARYFISGMQKYE